MNKKIKMTILISTVIILLIYSSITLIIYFSQNKLLYHPGENNYLDENSLNHTIEKIYIPSENKLLAWHFKKNKNYKTILFSMEMQGNLIIEFINLTNYQN